jgi:hypothetical protein
MGPVVLALLMALSFLPAPTPIQGQVSQEDSLARLAQDFMEALSSRDVEILDALLAPDAMIYSLREGDEGPRYGVRTRTGFLDGIRSGSSPILERIWDPVVQVKGSVAMVWAPYDFHAEGSFSHCGIDILTYLKLEDGWKVTSITYDVVREGCEASPLGPPGLR